MEYVDQLPDEPFTIQCVGGPFDGHVKLFGKPSVVGPSEGSSFPKPPGISTTEYRARIESGKFVKNELGHFLYDFASD